MMLIDTSVWLDHFNAHDSREAIRLQQAISNN
jgi:predicted nucleic acid-binding protein